MGNPRPMTDETKTSVGGAEAPAGPRGELLMARTPEVALRLWEGEDAGERNPEHSNSYDYVAYVLSGALRVTIGDAEAVEVRAGDSYAVPAQTPYSFEVLEAATVVEAVSPPDAL